MGQKREKREEKQIELCSTEDPDISSSTDVPMRSGQEGDSVKEPDPVGKKAVSRCSECRRRVGLTGFRCRCGELFCSEHRYSDRHDCRFDYKAAGRAAIARENPLVRPAKILKV